MDRFKLPLKESYLDNGAESPIFKVYHSDGPYMHFHKLNVLSWKIVSIDENSIPINLHHGDMHYNPVTIAHYGLELYSLIMRGDKSEILLEKFSNVVKWCLENQSDDGGWPFSFDHLFFKDRVASLNKNWYSGLSQGMMISVLTRARTLLNIDVSSSINRSLDVILKPVELGGVRRIFYDKYDFYEEYPTTPASFVLNGFIFCLIGIYDGWQLNKDDRFFNAYKSGVNSLSHMLPFYDLGLGSSYDLTHLTSLVEGPNRARHSYHRLHIQLLSTINSIEGGVFDRVVNRWDSYLKGNELITN